MTPRTSPSSAVQADLALARAIRERPRGPWRPCWGRIAALGFSLAAWSLAGLGVAALIGVRS